MTNYLSSEKQWQTMINSPYPHEITNIYVNVRNRIPHINIQCWCKDMWSMFNLPLPDQPQSQGEPPLILISMDWLIDWLIAKFINISHDTHIEEHLIPTVSMIGPSKFLWICMDPYQKNYISLISCIYIYIYLNIQKTGSPQLWPTKTRLLHRAGGFEPCGTSRSTMRSCASSGRPSSSWRRNGWRMGVEPPPWLGWLYSG